LAHDIENEKGSDEVPWQWLSVDDLGLGRHWLQWRTYHIWVRVFRIRQARDWGGRRVGIFRRRIGSWRLGYGL
jgi:hypothetical protein